MILSVLGNGKEGGENVADNLRPTMSALPVDFIQEFSPFLCETFH